MNSIKTSKDIETLKNVADLIAHAIEGKYYNTDGMRDILRHAIRRVSDGLNNWHAYNDFRTIKVVEKLNRARKDVLSSPSKYHRYCNKNFRHEHVVPAIVTYEYIIVKNITSKEDVIKTLKKLCITATITKEEDEMLSKMGFTSKMPKEFYNKSSDLYDNPLARYIVAGIIKSVDDFKESFRRRPLQK